MTLIGDLRTPAAVRAASTAWAARAGGGLRRGAREIKAIFAEMRAKADATPGMVGPYNEIELS
jgi:hypothetical protein